MANTNNNTKKNAEQENTKNVTEEKNMTTDNSTEEKQQSPQIDIAEMYAAMSAQYVARKSANGGNALPYNEITEAVDKVFDETGIVEAPISVLVEMTKTILKTKYTAMKDSKVAIVYKQGREFKKMPEGELKAIRLAQLNAMSSSKQKDNLYRRIYGLGYRVEFKRFKLAGNGILRRLKSPSNSSTKNGSE